MKKIWGTIMSFLLTISLLFGINWFSVTANFDAAAMDKAGEIYLYLPLLLNNFQPGLQESYLERALNGEFSGTVVTINGAFGNEDAIKFNNSMASFETQTGIDIQYEYLPDFENTIKEKINEDNAPDIASFPQPGLLADFVKTGDVIDLSQYLNIQTLQSNYKQSWLDMAMIEGPSGEIMAGVWYRVNGKSLVWYPKDDFITAGYEIPTTWNEMISLSQQIVDDGNAAWCIGIESGAATGWTATDWIEDIMLRTTSLENYDKWVNGELNFSSPEVKHAVQVMSDLWFAEGFTYGGRSSISTTFFGDAPTPMFEETPQCWLHRQGSFITSFFPAEAEAGVDYDFFPLPSIEATYGNPVLVAGDIMAAFSERDEVLAVMEYFSTGESLEAWIKAGGAISPHQDSSLDWYINTIDRKIAEMILTADSVRFDGSDLMPGEVGAGAFWEEITKYISDTIDLDTALANIDAAWPE